MLVLTRKVGESIHIGDDILIKIVEVSGKSVRVGIDAPRSISILRQEVYENIQKENILSSKAKEADLLKALDHWQKKSKQSKGQNIED